jgi:DNA-binding response OmpR family regulator
MLRLFLHKRNRPLAQDEIRAAVWGFSHFVSLTDIDRAVARLRSKIEPDPDNPVFLRAIGDTGYRFEMP